MKQTTVLIIDDHKMMREALATIIDKEKDLKVVGQADDGRKGAEEAARLKPDVVTLDVAMPNLNGLDSARHIIRRSPATRVLMLTAYEEDLYLQHALEAGVDGFITKHNATAVLTHAIREVARGKKHFSRNATRKMAQYEKDEKDGTLHRKQTACLTEREIEVLQLIAEGNANKQTADHLGISIKTVEKHRQHLMEKLNIHDTATLTRYAVSAGLVETPTQFTMRPVLAHHPAPKDSQ
jgi:DNA-binding NarL/FixJ family response regulator